MSPNGTGGRYALTTLRAAVIVGRGRASLSMIEPLARRLPIVVTPRWVRTRCQPIAIDDVVAYLVAVLDVPRPRARRSRSVTPTFSRTGR